MRRFYSENITFKNVNMFDCTEIGETIYEGVVEPSYEQYTGKDANDDGHIREKNVEAALSKNYL